VNRKRLIVDVIGYATLIPFFMLYNYLERIRANYVAVLVPVIAYLPVAAIWHFYYSKYSHETVRADSDR
jgi:hypothetical protein